MPLVPLETEGPRERPPWRGAVAGLVAAACFVVGLALAAWFTRDGSGPVRPPRPASPLGPDAGMAAPLVASADAGSADTRSGDAGIDAARVTAEPEPDAGPVGASAPPIEVSALAAMAQPILQACLAEALRFDPSFGGRMTLRAELRGRTLEVVAPAGASPVFTRCLAQKHARMEGEPRRLSAALRANLDGLRQTATVLDVELVE